MFGEKERLIIEKGRMREAKKTALKSAFAGIERGCPANSVACD
jgi:hypothetical protein